MTEGERPNERQEANLAEPLASKYWSRRTDKKFTDFAKNGFFQHNQPNPTDAARRTNDRNPILNENRW